MNGASRPYLHIGVFPAPQITRISISDAPRALDGLRICFVSDVHLRACVSDAKLNALTRLIDAQKAHLLLLGGDYGEGTPQCARFFEAIAPLRFPLGTFAVPGNNDAPEALARAAEKAGVRLLVNRSETISFSDAALEIAGCDDYKYGAPDTSRLFSASNAYRILVSHFPVPPKCGCDLELSGHTHGGQFSLFGLNPYSILFENEYGIAAIDGVRKVNGVRLIVSRGIGVSRIPMRVGTPPEIILAAFDRK